MIEPPAAKRRKKGWTFLRAFRWTVYVIFTALMVFIAICVAVGIAANITERYPELELPSTRPASLDDFSSLQLQDCREAMERMRREDLAETQAAFTGEQDRDAFLRRHRAWTKQWRQRFEKLGISCRLTEYRYDGHPTLGSLAEIYRRLDEIHKVHERLVRRYVTENARRLRAIKELLAHTGRQLDLTQSRTSTVEQKAKAP